MPNIIAFLQKKKKPQSWYITLKDQHQFDNSDNLKKLFVLAALKY